MAYTCKLLDGGATADLSQFRITSGSFSSSTTQVRTGSRSYQSNPSTSGLGYGAYAAQDRYGTAWGNLYVFRAYVYIDTMPASNNEPILSLFSYNPGGVKTLPTYVLGISVNIGSDGKLRLYKGGGTSNQSFLGTGSLVTTGTTVLSTATWYRIDGYYNNSDHTMAIRVNGTTELSGTGAPSLLNNSTTTTLIALGKTANYNSQGYTVYFDDISIGIGGANTDYPSAGQVYNLTPSAIGSLQGTWTGSASSLTSNDGDTSTVSVTTSTTQDITFTFSSLPSGSVNSVMWHAIARKASSGTGSGVTLTPISYSGSKITGSTTNESTIGATTDNTSYKNIQVPYATAPDGTSWTQTKVNAYEYGIEVANSAFVTYFSMVVDYGPLVVLGTPILMAC